MKRSRTGFWLFALPTLIPFLTMLILPTLSGMYYAMTDWNGMRQQINWIGLENFKACFSDQQFFHSFVFTAKFALVAVIVVNLLGFFYALLVTQGRKGSNLVRSILFMPNLIGGVLLGFTWQFVFVQAFDAVGVSLGIPALRHWLSTESTGFWGLIIMLSWQSGGYMMLIYIAQLSAIPDQLAEAARIDGANSFQVLKSITLPLMIPAFTTCLFMTLAFSFKIFDYNISLTNGNPLRTTEMLALNVYKEDYTYNNMGYAQAKAIIYLLIVAIITLSQLYLTKRREVEL